MVSATADAELRSDAYSEIYAELAILESDSWDAPLRLVNIAEEGFTLESDGETFYAYPFKLTWPAFDPEQPFAGGRFEINNVVAQDGTDEPVLIGALRGIPARARIRFQVVRLDTPDVIEAQTTRLRLTGVSYDQTTITGVVSLPDFTGRRAGRRFTPDMFPNLRAG